MMLVRNIIFSVDFSKRFEDDEGMAGKSSRFDSLIMETQAVAGSMFLKDCLPSKSWLDKLTGMKRRLTKNFNDCDIHFIDNSSTGIWIQTTFKT